MEDIKSAGSHKKTYPVGLSSRVADSIKVERVKLLPLKGCKSNPFLLDLFSYFKNNRTY